MKVYLTSFTSFLFLVCGIVLLTPSNAYAYLDPGTGSALFTSLAAIVSTGLYWIKSFFYKITGRSLSQVEADNKTLVIFSEGKTYWTTFEPIINELIKQKIHFRYVSIDALDPALKIESEYMHSKLYPKSNSGFGRIAALETPVMLATTPNIGSEGYPFPRPKKAKNLVHIFHDFVAGANYRLGSLDFYTIAITTGEYAEKYLRKVEEIRKTEAKEIIALGLPYLDTLKKELESNKITSSEKSEKKTLLIAPSWGSKGCFNYFGTDFVHDLHAADYTIIVRLHPHSYVNEPEKVARWKKDLSSLERVTWDEELSNTKAMQEADILVSDTSSVRFDFAFLHLKPVITLAIPAEKRVDFESSYHDKTWDIEIAAQIGAVIQKEEINTISTTVSSLLADFSAENIQQIRDENIANFGNSSEKIVVFLQEKIKISENN